MAMILVCWSPLAQHGHSQTAPPANDDLANATLIVGTKATVVGSNLGATLEPGESLGFPHGGQFHSSVWWVWTPPESGLAYFSTAGSGFDTWLGVYTNADAALPARLAGLELAGFSDDEDGELTSRASFDVVQGVAYYVLVGGAVLPEGPASDGDIQLTVGLGGAAVVLKRPIEGEVLALPGAFELCAEVSTDSIGPFSRVQFYNDTILLATVFGSGRVGGGVETVCYGWTNPPVGPYRLSAVVSLPNGQRLASAPVRAAVRIPNDDLARASVLSGAVVRVEGTTLGATHEPDEPFPSNYSVWYQWTAPFSGRAMVEAHGAGGDPVLSVYLGSSIASLVLVGQTDFRGPNQMIFDTLAGTTYLITVDGDFGREGAFTLQLVASKPPIVTLTKPLETANPWIAPATITLEAGLEYGDRNVARVDFFARTTEAPWTPDVRLGSDTDKPFVVSWSNVPQGEYWLTARATDTLGIVSTSAVPVKVVVVGLPVIAVEPPDVIAPVGRRVTLRVEAAPGAGAYHYQWYFKPTANAAETPMQGGPPNVLDWWVQPAHEGYYRAEVSNEAGTVRSRTAFLNVLEPFEQIGRFDAGERMSLAPAIGPDGSVYVVGGEGGQSGTRLYSLGRYLEATNWVRDLSEPARTSPAVGPDGTIYVGAGRNLQAFDPSGNVKWNAQAPSLVGESPAIGADGAIYVGTDQGELLSIDPADGQVNWVFRSGQALNLAPSVGTDGAIIVLPVYTGNARPSEVFALRPERELAPGAPRLKWRFPLADGEHLRFGSYSALGPDGTVYFLSDLGSQGTLYALDAKGTLKWRQNPFAAGGPAFGGYSPAVGADGTVYAGVYVGVNGLSARDPRTGEERRHWDGLGSPAGCPAIGADGVIYATSLAQRTGGRYHFDLNALFPDGSSTNLLSLETRLGDTVSFSPVLSPDGVVYLGTPDGFLYGYHAGTGPANSSWPMAGRNARRNQNVAGVPGDFLWSARCGLYLNGSPAFGPDGLVYLGAASVTEYVPLYSFTHDGRTNAVFHSGRGSGSPAIGRDGTVYFGVDIVQAPPGGELLAVSPNGTNFTTLWRLPLAGPLYGNAPAVGGDGAVYIATYDGTLHATNPVRRTGWALKLARVIESSLGIGPDGTVYAGVIEAVERPGFSGNGMLAVSPEGRVRWAYPLLGQAGTSPAVGPDGAVYFVEGGIGVHALRPTGEANWVTPLAGLGISSPVIGPDRTIYVVTGYGTATVHALEPERGRQRWECPLTLVPWAVRTTPAVGADGVLYVGAGTSFFAVRDLGLRGERQWSFGLPKELGSSPIVLPTGEVCFGCDDGRLYALRASSGPALAYWPAFRGNLARTGSADSSPPPPEPPLVILAAPAGDTSVAASEPVALEARLVPEEAAVARVTFLANGFEIGAAYAAPYRMVWSNAVAGAYVLTASVVDAAGQRVNSSPVVVSVRPANDMFAAAEPLVGSQVSVRRSNRLATPEPGEPHHAGGLDASVWFSWQAPAVGRVTVATTGSSFDTLLAVYTGGTVAALNRVAENDDSGESNGASRVSFYTLPGMSYKIAVDGYQGATGDLLLSLDFNEAPSVALVRPDPGVEYFAPASILVQAEAQDTRDGIDRVEFHLNGSLLAVDMGSPYVTNLTGLAAGVYTFTAQAVDRAGVVATSAPVVVTVNFPLPANDDFAQRSSLGNLFSAQAAGHNQRASKEHGEPDHAGEPGGHSIWWQWTAPDNGVVTIDTLSTNTTFDTVLAVYQGSTFGNLRLVKDDAGSAADGASRVVFAATAGTRYQIAVDGAGGTVGTVELHLVLNRPPTVSVSSPPDQSQYDAPASIPISVKAQGEGGIARLEVFQNAALLRTFSESPFGLTWANVVAGDYALTAVATDRQGLMSTSPPVRVTVRGAPVAPSVFSLPGDRTVAVGSTVELLVMASGTPPLTYQWRRDESPLNDRQRVNGARTERLRIANVQPSDGGDYTVQVRNGSGATVSRAVAVRVALPPVILLEPQGVSVAAGESAALSVQAAGTGPFSYQWRRNGQDLPGANADSLRIDAAQQGDSGSYVVMVRNEVGEALSAEAVVAVSGGPLGQEPPATPREDFWIADDTVRSIVATNGVVYLGGDFHYVGPNTGSAGWVDAESGRADRHFPRIDGDLRVGIPDGAGGWFLGGSFSAVGGIARTNLARLRSDFSVDTSWAPNPNGRVEALIAAAGQLYVGGRFTVVAGQARTNLAALELANGSLAPWAPNPDGAVLALAVWGDSLYAGGEFLNVEDGRSRKRLAAFSLADGSATAWKVAANGTVFALAADAGVIYVGGEFRYCGGLSRSRLAAVTADAGTVTDWDPSADNTVKVIAVAGGTLYVGGFFSSIHDQPHRFVAAISQTTGEPLAWDPGVDNTVRALAVSPESVYLAGDFRFVGGQGRNRLARVGRVDGQPLEWNPNASHRAQAIWRAGGSVFVGGEFKSLGGVEREHLAALDAGTGAALGWSPGADGPVNVLAVDRATVYVGGNFDYVGGQGRTNLAAVDALSGQTVDWSAHANDVVDALVVTGRTLYAGGAFTQVGDQARGGLVALSLDNAAVLDWQVAVEGRVRALALAGEVLYLGGDFVKIGGVPRRSLGAVSALDGHLLAWQPEADGPVTTLAVGAAGITAGGLFATVGGQPRSGLVILDAAGDPLAWDAGARNSGGSSFVGAVAVSGSSIYAGGLFTQAGGQNRRNLAALGLADGSAAGWNPNADRDVAALSANGNILYVGGGFSSVGGQVRPHFAAFAPAGFPILLEQPREQTVALRSNYTNSVVVSGRAPLFFQWQRDGADLEGETNSTLVLLDVRRPEAGNYRVVVSNAVGRVESAVAALRVLRLPEITTQPASLTVQPNEAAEFGVQADGEQPLRYQWQRTGANLPGQTNRILRLEHAQVTDAGEYRVVVSNPAGALSSAGATLGVLVPSDAALVDAFAGRQLVIDMPRGTAVGTTRGAGREAREPDHARKPGGRSLWFAWRAPASGIATFNTIGSGIDTLLAVYTGSTLGSLQLVAADEDSGGSFASLLAFNAVQGMDYNIAVDGFGGAQGAVVVNWALEPTTDDVPVVRVAPSSQTVVAGSKVVLSVTAESLRTLNYQWFHNDEALAGGNGPTYTLVSVQPRDVGRYTVRVSNATRSVTTAPAVIEIGPDNGARSEDKLADLGQPGGGGAGLLGARKANFASVSDGALGSELLNPYGATKDAGEPNHAGETGGRSLWFQLNIETPGTLIVDTMGSEVDTVLAVYTGDPADMLNLNPEAADVNSAPDGIHSWIQMPVERRSYLVVADTPDPQQQGNIRLNWRLGNLPSITYVPVLVQTNRVGDTVMWSITASGSPTPSYQWRKDGVDLPGQTNATLRLTNVRLADAGSYSVVVANALGRASSRVAEMTVTGQEPPTIVVQPLGQSATVGSTVTFSVQATGSAPLSYQWLFNGQAIPAATGATLVLTNVQAAAAGRYSVLVANAAGSRPSDEVVLTVVQSTPPAFETTVLLPDGLVRIRLAGSAGQTIVIEVSSDLSQWAPWLTNVFSGGLLELTDPPAQPRRFYRARPAP